jgi:transcriptional regulator with XRE-family HTH domain
MTHQQDIADRLAQLRREKSARERRDVTQAMIAEACGLVPETYSRYENGKRKVPEEVIQVLADYFGTTAPFIRYGIGEQPITTFRIPDSMAEMFSRALQAEASPAPAPEEPVEEPAPPPRKAAGGRRGGGRSKGRR